MLSRGFLTDDQHHVVMQSGWSKLRSWEWLIKKRESILLQHELSRNPSWKACCGTVVHILVLVILCTTFYYSFYYYIYYNCYDYYIYTYMYIFVCSY